MHDGFCINNQSIYHKYFACYRLIELGLGLGLLIEGALELVQLWDLCLLGRRTVALLSDDLHVVDGDEADVVALGAAGKTFSLSPSLSLSLSLSDLSRSL